MRKNIGCFFCPQNTQTHALPQGSTNTLPCFQKAVTERKKLNNRPKNIRKQGDSTNSLAVISFSRKETHNAMNVKETETGMGTVSE